MLKISPLLIMIIIFIFPISALANKLGGDSYTFLKLPPGARAIGLGNAFLAIADDATAIYWNPAGITQLSTKEATFMSSLGGNSELENKYIYFSIVYPIDFSPMVEEKIGFSLINYSIDNIKKTTRDNFGNLVRLGEFDNKENALIFCYSREIFKNLLSAGANIKYMRHKFDTYLGNGIGLDIGLLANVSNIFNRGVDRPILKIARDVKMGFCIIMCKC